MELIIHLESYPPEMIDAIHAQILRTGELVRLENQQDITTPDATISARVYTRFFYRMYARSTLTLVIIQDKQGMTIMATCAANGYLSLGSSRKYLNDIKKIINDLQK